MKFVFSASVLIGTLLFLPSVNASIINYDFNSGSSSDLTTFGTTQYNSNGYGTNNSGHMDLSPNMQGTGSFFFNEKFNSDYFEVEFDFVAGGGSGADGLTFSWVESAGLGHGGSQLGFSGEAGLTGYAVRYDTFHHFASELGKIDVIKNTAGDSEFSIITPTVEASFEDTSWHHTRIVFNQGSILVDLDGTNRLNARIDNYTAFDAYFGFTGATGGLTNYHKIDNVVINSTLPTSVPEPSTLAIFALGIVGLASRRFKKQS